MNTSPPPYLPAFGLHDHLCRQIRPFVLLLGVVWVGTGPAAGQTPKIDSLLHLVRHATVTKDMADTTLAQWHIDLTAKRSKAGDMDSAATHTQKAIALLAPLLETHPKDRKVNLLLAKANRHAGRLKYFDSLYDESLQYMQRANTHATIAEDTVEIGRSIMYMGFCFREMNDTQQALTYTRQAIATLARTEERTDLGTAIMSMGGIFTNVDMTDSALFHFRNALDVFQRTGSRSQVAAVLLNMTGLFNNIGAHDSVDHYLMLAEPYAPALSPPAQVRYHGMVGRALTMRKDFRNALQELELAESLADGNPSDLAEILHVKALAYAGSQDMPAAMNALRAGDDAMVQDLDLAKVQAVTEQRLLFEHERETAEAAAKLVAEQERKRTFILLTICVLVIAAMLLALLLNARRNSAALKAKNAEILRAQHQVVEVEKQRENEQVRTRIARDIHDDIGSGLTKITMLGNDAKRRVRESPDEVVGALDRIIGHSREVNAALSDIVWTVDPLHDTSTELVSHARMVTQRLLEDTPLRADLHFSHNDPSQPVAPNTKHHMMMVLKEALNNAMKYGGDSDLLVEFRAGAHGVHMRVTDHGPGFDNTTSGREGNGLRNMQKRAEAIGATLTVNSSPGKGCTVELRGSTL